LRSKPSFLSTCALRADALLDSPIGKISLIGTDDSRLFFLNLEGLCSEFMFPFLQAPEFIATQNIQKLQPISVGIYLYMVPWLLCLQGVAFAPWLSNYLMYLISLFVPYLGPPKVSVLSAFFVLIPRHQELVYCKKKIQRFQHHNLQVDASAAPGRSAVTHERVSFNATLVIDSPYNADLSEKVDQAWNELLQYSFPC